MSIVDQVVFFRIWRMSINGVLDGEVAGGWGECVMVAIGVGYSGVGEV